MTDIERFNEFCDWWENHIDELAEKVVGHITKDFVTVDDLKLGIREGELNGQE